MTPTRALTSKPPVRFHFIHRWSFWQLVIRKDIQGGEFWSKECLVCGKIKGKLKFVRFYEPHS